MKCETICFLAIVVTLTVSVGSADSGRSCSLAGWGIDEKNLDQFMADAEAVGFAELITWSTDPVVVGRDVEAGARHNIRVYSCIAPMGGVGGLWDRKYPGRPVPWQVMSEDEEAARRFIMAGDNQYLIPYQFGGEPKLTNEVLGTRIICFSNEECRELLKLQIDGIVSVPGIAGLALDGFGYQNYRGCACERCRGLLNDYREAHPDLSGGEAETTFFRDALVEYINDLADHARSRRSDIKTCIHVWPVFAPEPLYGNRLDVDLCGQTAAWYTLWPQEKIVEYSRIISEQARKYHQRQQGVGMIGYYDRPGQFPVKDPARVEMEIRTMIENGCQCIQVCGSKDVINNPEIAAVFRRYFR